jgi:hypothetical protein
MDVEADVVEQDENIVIEDSEPPAKRQKRATDDDDDDENTNVQPDPPLTRAIEAESLVSALVKLKADWLLVHANETIVRKAVAVDDALRLVDLKRDWNRSLQWIEDVAKPIKRAVNRLLKNALDGASVPDSVWVKRLESLTSTIETMREWALETAEDRDYAVARQANNGAVATQNHYTRPFFWQMKLKANSLVTLDMAREKASDTRTIKPNTPVTFGKTKGRVCTAMVCGVVYAMSLFFEWFVLPVLHHDAKTRVVRAISRDKLALRDTECTAEEARIALTAAYSINDVWSRILEVYRSVKAHVRHLQVVAEQERISQQHGQMEENGRDQARGLLSKVRFAPLAGDVKTKNPAASSRKRKRDAANEEHDDQDTEKDEMKL